MAKNTTASRSDKFYSGRCVVYAIFPERVFEPLLEQKYGREKRSDHIDLEILGNPTVFSVSIQDDLFGDLRFVCLQQWRTVLLKM